MVRPMHWEPALAVGVTAFDEAHQTLVGRAAALIAVVEAADAAARMRDVMDDLVECAVEHFDEEERTLRELDWPGLPAHLQAHNQLLRTLLKFKSDLRYGRLSAEDAAEFITDWVCTHILDEDMKYRDYLAARGVH